jgi:GTP pyrophosphokinase
MVAVINTEADVEELIPTRLRRYPEAVENIRHAWAFAQAAHAGQYRRSGEPYAAHLFETAKMLRELGMGPATIVAGILHDTCEDTPTSIADIERLFGREVAFMVDGLTKLGSEQHKGAAHYAENLRKLLLAASKDVRILIVKLCDRLHNMQTLTFMSPAAQKRIALETLNVHVPVADRLGMHAIKRELEDLAFSYVEPEQSRESVRLLAERKADREKSVREAARILQENETITARLPFRVERRDKGVYSFFQKLARKNGNLSQINDAIVLQVIVSTTDDCYIMLGNIHGLWHPVPGKFKDYIAFPKPNGFQCLRTTIDAGPLGILELQIYSEDMYARAKHGLAVLLARSES